MRPVVGLLALLLLALGAYVWFGGVQRREQREWNGREPERSPPTKEAVDPPGTAAVPPEDPSQARSEVVLEEPVPTGHPGGIDGESGAGVERRVITGRLVDGATGVPLGGFRLSFGLAFRGARGELVAAVTDGDGRFETAAVPTEKVLVSHRPDAAAELVVPWWIEPSYFELPSTDDGSSFELELAAYEPPHALDVEVVYDDGRPAAGASVELKVHGSFVELDSGVRLYWSPYAETNSEGLARLPVWRSEGREGRLLAWDERDFISDPETITSPFVPGRRRLVLLPGGEIVVAARDASGAPIPNPELRVNPTRRSAGYERTREASGELRLHRLLPGDYRLTVYTHRTSGVHDRIVGIRRGEHVEVEFLLEESLPLAVRGTVLDEKGAPLPGVEIVVLAHPHMGAARVVSGEGGVFGYWCEPLDAVRVVSASDPEADAFEPASTTVPFGTRDLVLRRVAVAREHRFAMEAFDRSTGAQVPEFLLTLDHGPGSEHWQKNTFAPRRVFEIAVRPGVRAKVAARGYQTAVFDLEQAVAGLPDGETLRIELDAGLVHSFQIVDSEDDRPLEGVVLRSATGPEVRSDADGWIHIVTDLWSTYTAELEGYESEEWDPGDFVLYDWGTMHLFPVEDLGEEE